MKAIFITGMSATGKSTIIQDLAARGYTAIDLDTDNYSTWIDVAPDPLYPDNEVAPGKDWVWHEGRVRELLTNDYSDLLFVSGCASNMEKFYPYFRSIILLTAPEEIIVQRLQCRQGDAYGQSPEEIARVLRLKKDIEPLLRESADLEINTSTGDQPVADQIIQYVNNNCNE